MRDELVIALAKLASKDYQIRYIIEGTAASHVMPEEILEDVDGLCLRAQRPENEIQLNSRRNRHSPEFGVRNRQNARGRSAIPISA